MAYNDTSGDEPRYPGLDTRTELALQSIKHSDEDYEAAKKALGTRYVGRGFSEVATLESTTFTSQAEYEAREQKAADELRELGYGIESLPSVLRQVLIGGKPYNRPCYQILQHGYVQSTGIALPQLELYIKKLRYDRAEELAEEARYQEKQRALSEAAELQRRWMTIQDEAGEPAIPRLIMALLDRVDSLEKRLAE